MSLKQLKKGYKRFAILFKMWDNLTWEPPEPPPIDGICGGLNDFITPAVRLLCLINS